MGNKKLLLPGTSKITFQPNSFVLILWLYLLWAKNNTASYGQN